MDETTNRGKHPGAAEPDVIRLLRADQRAIVRTYIDRKVALAGANVARVLLDAEPDAVRLSLIDALQIVEYALHLRQYGERAPGGNETWAEFDRRAETFLRSMKGPRS